MLNLWRWIRSACGLFALIESESSIDQLWDMDPERND